MKKLYPVFGMTSCLAYAMAVIVGGFLIEGYSHIYNSISELTASNIPRIPIIVILFAIYNVALIVFGLGLYADLKSTNSKRIKAASILLIILGILGVGMLYFVQDPRDIQMSFNGKMHIILASISSFLTMGAIILAAMGFKGNPVMKKLTKYSYISFLIVFLTGGFAAANLANNTAYVGLFERLTIGAYLQWVFVVSVKLYLSNSKAKLVSEKSQVL